MISGLSEYGLVYQTPSGEELTLVLGDSGAGVESVEFGHLLTLEEMQVSPQELISYFFYADDIGPDGEVRRTFSDMFFAEVRHFDEEYRQMPFQQGQQQQQQQQGGQAGQLLELQRQVVSATWNTIRKFPLMPESSETAEFVDDVSTIEEGQSAVVDLASAAQAQLSDAVALQYLSDAVEYMEAARRELSTAARTPSIDPLPDARLKSQDAYQALLKLQAREHLIQQAQQGSGQQASNRSNRQLDQLELKNDRNRYEQENQAQQEQQQQANREQLQVLNRLRELARRQEDLNERIKELENKLRDADEEEREELERQLQRLQEEQQELLRDVEELQERMNTAGKPFRDGRGTS